MTNESDKQTNKQTTPKRETKKDDSTTGLWKQFHSMDSPAGPAMGANTLTDSAAEMVANDQSVTFL